MASKVSDYAFVYNVYELVSLSKDAVGQSVCQSVCPCWQLSRLLVGDLNDRYRRDVIRQLSDTKTSHHLADTSTSLLSTGGLIYRLMRNNPQLLMNAETRRLLMRMLEMNGLMDQDELGDMSALMTVSHTVSQ